MDLHTKLAILSTAAKYDVSCSSSGSKRTNTPGGVGNAAPTGICHSFSADGRCISLLKVLYTNDCIYNCAYCANKASNDVPRASFTPHEITELTINFYRRNYIEGLFLSSAIQVSPDHTMEQLLKVVKSLREDHRFNGYIHLKAIPGADMRLVQQAGHYADRMSVNIELPSENSLKLLAPQKKKDAIIKPMGFISSQIGATKEEKKLFKKSPNFVPAGQSTQLIVGATGESDLKIISLSEGLYNRFGLKRVYYSAYVPVNSHPNLPTTAQPPLVREHRLYQADWLLRFYGFSAGELLNSTNQNFDLELDPKSNWALNNLHLFPLEINKVEYQMLLRIPGVGVRSAQRILSARRVTALNYEDLKKLGVVLKRAKHFITCKGKYYGEKAFRDTLMRQLLISKPKGLLTSFTPMEQMTIFNSNITGEF